jgi:hypothetical protein
MNTNEEQESLRVLMEQYIEVYSSIQAVKLHLKQLNLDFKSKNPVVLQFLTQHPGRTCRVTATHSVQLKQKIKTAGLNPLVIGEGYLAFQHSRGREATTEERDAFLLSLKELRKTKTDTVEDVHVLINQ